MLKLDDGHVLKIVLEFEVEYRMRINEAKKNMEEAGGGRIC